MSMTKFENQVEIQEFRLEYLSKEGEKKRYIEMNTDPASSGLSKIHLPFDLNTFNPDKITVQFCTRSGKDSEIDDIEIFQYLVNREKEQDDDDKEQNNDDKVKFEDVIENDIVLRELDKTFFEQDNDKIFPSIVYSDVTETDMFGYEEMMSSALKSGGVWGNHGFRKIKIHLDDCPKSDADDCQTEETFYWNQIESEDIPTILEDEIHTDNDDNFYVYVDTNRLQNVIDEKKLATHCPKFNGRFIYRVGFIKYESIFDFPVEMCVNDVVSEEGIERVLDKKPVSIDFGTSATCAAVQNAGSPKLFTLSGPMKRDAESKDNPYENPTNVMVYHWDEVYKQWSKDNKGFPFFVTKSENADETIADYDSGYNVEDEYKDIDAEDGRRKMAAIMTQLKSMPYWLSKGWEKSFIPYWDENRKPVAIVDTLDDMGETKFNPIAFYGYLLGRVINMPANGKIYTKYQITYPVKFDKDVREKIRQSLEYGLKRALPISIRDGVNKRGKSIVSVTMKYSEPVACIGAITGSQLKISANDEIAKLFAIYDLGGGTMDFAYGIFRKAKDDEAEESDQVIEILGVDGNEKIGGEKLIHKLAYQIYLASAEQVKENKIKFVLPDGELNPEGFEGLLTKPGDEIAESNVQSIKEKLARILFMHDGPVDGKLVAVLKDQTAVIAENAKSIKMTLRGQNNEGREITLTVDSIDDFLKKEIKDSVESFHDRMDYYFGMNLDKLTNAGIKEYKPADVHIFLGGNASKQYLVKELMAETFEKNDIQRIGKNENINSQTKKNVNEDTEAENVNEDTEAEHENVHQLSSEYMINEKTAVAFGQLKLGDYMVKEDAIKVTEDLPPFGFYVGYIDSGSGEFVTVLNKNDNKANWVKANHIDYENEQTNLYYTQDPTMKKTSLIPLAEDISELIEEHAKKRTLYVRVKEEDSIEVGLGTSKEEPEENSKLCVLTLE